MKRFLETLKHYNEADYQREHLSNRFIEYNQQYNQTQKYLDTPFLWFAVDYFSHANLTLSLAKFDGKTFYEYLTKPLKKSAQSKGLFSLIKNSTSLMDLEWENLQVTSTRININLLDEHLITLNSIFKTIEELGVQSLNSTELKKKNTENTSKFSYMRDYKNFHRLIDSQWALWFYPPAFNLSHVYINILLEDNSNITDLIDFNDSQNTTLCNSRIYRISKSKNEYCGYLTIPSRMDTSLKEVFTLNQEKEKIIIKKYEKVSMERIGTSFTLYEVNKGWTDSIPSLNKQILYALNRKKDPILKSTLSNFYITPEFNDNWNFQKFIEPAKLILLYCKGSLFYNFDFLPLNKVTNSDQSTNRYNMSDVGLLKYLYEKGACRITYVANRLLYAFSPYQYEIILPKMTSNKFEHFVSWIPYIRSFDTEKFTFLWVNLTPKMAWWIKNKLKWSVRQIVPYYYSIHPHFDWFNFKKSIWKKPHLFETNS